MTKTDKDTYIGHIRSGSGRGFAASQLGLTMRTINAEIKADPDFADAIATEELAYADMVLSVVGSDALAGSVSAAMAWSSHSLRAQAQADHLRLEKQKIRLKRKEISARVKAVDHITDNHESARLKLRNLDNDEFKRYAELQRKVAGGEELADSELQDYGKLTVRIYQAEESNDRKALRDLRSVDDMFDDREEYDDEFDIE